MDFEGIRQLIDDNKDKTNFGEFGQGAPDDWIENAQNRLGMRFPPSYIWWLKNYKGGEINGEEIFSVYNPEFSDIAGGDVIYINELHRKNGFSSPHQLVIQSNDQGEDYYFDLEQVDDKGESPVFVDPTRKKYADNFLHFLALKLAE